MADQVDLAGPSVCKVVFVGHTTALAHSIAATVSCAGAVAIQRRHRPASVTSLRPNWGKSEAVQRQESYNPSVL